MAVEQHLHRLLLEFVRIDTPLGLGWVWVRFHGSLLGCLVRVTPSSRSVHKSPYTSSSPGARCESARRVRPAGNPITCARSAESCLMLHHILSADTTRLLVWR